LNREFFTLNDKFCLEVDKNILAGMKKDFIAAQAELELLERQKESKTDVHDEASQG
jgi:hypothetical protein